MENSKTTCIFFKSLYDAAKELKKTDPMTALEIYSAYFDYAFGITEKVETDSQIARLLVMQNVDSLNAATKRYNAAVENGNKGKEYGKLGGRPRKGETKEEARKRRETPVKPQSEPQNLEEEKTPVKPLTVAVSEDVSISNSEDISKDNKITKEQITEVIDIPVEESQTPGTPNPERKVRFGKDFDFASAYQIPGVEGRLECQYYYVMNELPTYESNRRFNEDSLRWEEDQDISTLTNCMLYWYDGGREKLAEMVQGLPPNVTKDVIAYLVLYCKDYDTSGYNSPRYEVVYAK